MQNTLKCFILIANDKEMCNMNYLTDVFKSNFDGVKSILAQPGWKFDWDMCVIETDAFDGTIPLLEG